MSELVGMQLLFTSHLVPKTESTKDPRYSDHIVFFTYGSHLLQAVVGSHTTRLSLSRWDGKVWNEVLPYLPNTQWSLYSIHGGWPWPEGEILEQLMGMMDRMKVRELLIRLLDGE